MTDTPSHTHDDAHDHDCAQPELHAVYDGHGALSAPGRLDPELAAQITRKITAYAVIVGFMLTGLKLFIWKQTESVGILSSLVHSSLDLLAALATFFGVRYAARAPDAIHSYGRGKAEGIVAIVQASLVLYSAAHIAEEAIERFMEPQAVTHGGTVLAVMIGAIMLTGFLLMAQTHAIRATGSVAIKGDRAHYLSDMAANVAVIIGVGFAAFTPFARADAIVALLIAAWLVYTAYRVGRLAFNQLMDRELPDQERDYIRQIVLQDAQIQNVKGLRTRASGPHVHIQMHVDLPEELTLIMAHDIIASAEQRVLLAFPAADITIHPDPSGHTHGNSRFRQGQS